MHQPTPQRPSRQALNLARPIQPQLPTWQSPTALQSIPRDLNAIDALIKEYYQLLDHLPPSPPAPSFDNLLSFDPPDSPNGHAAQPSVFLRPLDLGDYDFESGIAGIPWPPKVIHMDRFGHKAGQPVAILSPQDRELLQHYLDQLVPIRELWMAQERRQWQKDRKNPILTGGEAEHPIVVEANESRKRRVQTGSKEKNPRADSKGKTPQVGDKEKNTQAVSKEKKPPAVGKERKLKEIVKGRVSKAINKGKNTQIVNKEGNDQIVEMSGYRYSDGSTFSP